MFTILYFMILLLFIFFIKRKWVLFSINHFYIIELRKFILVFRKFSLYFLILIYQSYKFLNSIVFFSYNLIIDWGNLSFIFSKCFLFLKFIKIFYNLLFSLSRFIFMSMTNSKSCQIIWRFLLIQRIHRFQFLY